MVMTHLYNPTWLTLVNLNNAYPNYGYYVTILSLVILPFTSINRELNSHM